MPTTYKVPSASGGDDHDVVVSDDRSLYSCDCMGYKTRKRCTHGDDLLKQLSSGNARPAPKVDTAVKLMPMLAKELTAKIRITPNQYVAETKYDGIRMIVDVKRPGVVSTWSRLGNSCDHRLSTQLAVSLSQLPVGIYDGELILPGEGTYSSDVTSLVNKSKLHFIVFDALRLLEVDVTSHPQRKRREHLESIFNNASFPQVQLAEQWKVSSRAELDEVVGAIWEKGGEGVILKDLNAPYATGGSVCKRTNAFLKLKEKDDAVLKVMGFVPSVGDIMQRGPFAMAVLQDDKGNWTVVKTKNDEELRRLEKEMLTVHKDISTWTYGQVKIGARNVTYISNHPRVGSALRIEFQRRTPDGSYRHPRWSRWGAE